MAGGFTRKKNCSPQDGFRRIVPDRWRGGERDRNIFKKEKNLIQRVAALEKQYQEQQETLSQILQLQKSEIEQMKSSFAEVKELTQKNITEAICNIFQESKHI